MIVWDTVDAALSAIAKGHKVVHVPWGLRHGLAARLPPGWADLPPRHRPDGTKTIGFMSTRHSVIAP